MPTTANQVLVAVPSDASRASVVSCLRQAGHRVIEAANGQDCLRLIAETKPELVLLDIELPDLSGVELGRQLKSNPSTAHIPVIHLSAELKDSDARMDALDNAADGFLTMPFAPVALLTQVQALLRAARAGDVLRESEHRFRALFEQNPDALFTLDEHGRFILANPACELISGYSVAELFAKTFQDLCAPDALANTVQVFAQALSGGETENLEMAIIRKDGQRVELLVTGTLVVIEGRTPGIYCAAKDITQQKSMEQILRETEQRYRALAELSPDAIFVNVEGRFVYANAAAAEVLGATNADAILGRSPLEFARAEQDESVGARIGNLLMAGRKAPVREARWKKLDGAMIDVEVAVAPIRWAGSPAVQVVVRDITQRKLAEEQMRQSELSQRDRLESLVTARTLRLTEANAALEEEIAERKQIELRFRESELRLDYALQSGELGVWDLDLKTNTAWRSLRHDQVFGYETLLPQWTLDDFFKHILPEYHASVRQMLQHAAATGTGWSAECKIRRVDGALRWIWFQGKPCSFEQQHPVRIIGVIRDITELREAQEEARQVRQSEERWNTTLGHTREGLIIANDSGEVFYSNAAARTIHGIAGLEEALGSLTDYANTFQLVQPEDGRILSQLEWPIPRILRGESVQNLELHLRRPAQGWTRIVSYYGTRLETAGGERIVFLSVDDLTDQRKAEEALRQARELLARSNQDLERTVEDRTARLQQTVADLEQFSYSLAHDLRAPLRSMCSFSSILLDEYSSRLDAEGLDYLNRIASASKRMDSLIRDVLTYSQVVRSQGPLEPVQLDGLVRDIVNQYPHLSSDQADIEVAGSLLSVVGNVALVTQCVSNLLGNAVKFVSPGVKPKVRLWTEQHDGWVRVCVRDHGIGVPADQLDRIWGIFERAHHSDQYVGTGIGLSIVKRAADRMGGSVGVRSQPGQGSTFWIDLRHPDWPPLATGAAVS